MTSDGQEPTRNSSLDVGTAREQTIDDIVQFIIGIRKARKIAFLHDGRGESRLGEHHYAGRRLQQMGTGARADDQKKGILNLAMKPYDSASSPQKTSR